MKNKGENGFFQSINIFTLKFADPEREEKFILYREKKLIVPMWFKILSYGVLGINVSYRFFALFISLTSKAIRTASAEIETGLVAYIVASICGEMVVRKVLKSRHLNGCFIYISLPISCLSAAFLTNKDHVLGMQYGYCLILGIGLQWDYLWYLGM